MSAERPELNRLEILRALQISNWEAVYATVHLTLTGGAFLTGFALFLGAGNFWMGVLFAFAPLAGLIQIYSSYIIERRGERKWFTAWCAGSGRFLWLPILILPFVFPPGLRFPVFLWLFLLSSLLLSMPVPAFTSWMSDLVPAETRGRYFGRRNMLAGITTMVVSLPAAWFLDQATKWHHFSESVGFGVVFGVAVVCGLLSFYCITRQAEPPMQMSDTPPIQGLRSLIAFYSAPFAEPNFRRFMLFGGLFAGAQWFAAPFYIVYAIKTLKLDYVWIQVFATVASLSSLASMPLWGYLADKFGNKPLLTIGCFGTGTLPLMWVITRPEEGSWVVFMLIINHILGGLFWAGVNLTQFNLLIAVTPGERKSVYVGAWSAVTGLIGGIAPVIGGTLLTALGDINLRPFGWILGSYQIVFLVNAALRFGAAGMLAGVQDTGSATARDVLSQLGTSRPKGWVQMHRLQRAQSEAGRIKAMQALRGARMTLAVEELVAALQDPSLHVREDAAESLGELGDPRAVGALVACIQEPGGGVVARAAAALGRIGDQSAVRPLISLLSSAEGPEATSAARALGRIGGSEARNCLTEWIQSVGIEIREESIEACVHALGKIGDDISANAIKPYLSSENRSLRLATARAMGDIGEGNMAEPLLDQLAIECDEAVVAHIAVALAMLECEESVVPLLNTVARVKSTIARKQILHAVGTLIGEEEGLYPMLGLEAFERDEAVGKLLSENSKMSRHADFGEMRRAKHNEHALTSYLDGDINGAIKHLVRSHATDGDDPGSLVIQWATVQAERRKLEPEEFLLVVFAVRGLE